MKSDDPTRSFLILLMLFDPVIIPKIPHVRLLVWHLVWHCRPLRAEILWSATLEVGAVRTMAYFTVGFISWTDYRRKIENVEDVLVVHPLDFRESDHWSVARPIPCVAIGLGEGSKCAPIKNCVQNSLIMCTTDRKWNQMSSQDRPSVYRVDWSDSQIGLTCQTNRKNRWKIEFEPDQIQYVSQHN